MGGDECGVMSEGDEWGRVGVGAIGIRNTSVKFDCGNIRQECI